MTSPEHSHSPSSTIGAKVPLPTFQERDLLHLIVNPGTKEEPTEALPAHEALFVQAALVQTAHQLTGRVLPDVFQARVTGVKPQRQMPIYFQDELGYGHTSLTAQAKFKERIGAVELGIRLEGGRETLPVNLTASAEDRATPWHDLEFRVAREGHRAPHALMSGEDVSEVLYALLPKLIKGGDTPESDTDLAFTSVSAIMRAFQRARRARSITQKTFIETDTAFRISGLNVNALTQADRVLEMELDRLTGQRNSLYDGPNLIAAGSKLVVRADTDSRRSSSCDLTRVVPWRFGDDIALSITKLSIPNLVHRPAALLHQFTGKNIRPELLTYYGPMAREDASAEAIQQSLIRQLVAHGLETDRFETRDVDQDRTRTPERNQGLIDYALRHGFDVNHLVPEHRPH